MAYVELQDEHWASLEAFLQPLSELYVEGEDKDHNTPPHFPLEISSLFWTSQLRLPASVHLSTAAQMAPHCACECLWCLSKLICADLTGPQPAVIKNIICTTQAVRQTKTDGRTFREGVGEEVHFNQGFCPLMVSHVMLMGMCVRVAGIISQRALTHLMLSHDLPVGSQSCDYCKATDCEKKEAELQFMYQLWLSHMATLTKWFCLL